MATLITLFAVSTTWIAITLTLQGQMYYSYIFALLAFIIDCLDGPIARFSQTQSQFGRQLDSLSDSLLYVIWPALVCYWYLQLQDPLSLIAQFVFIAAGLYRLARFNVIGMVVRGQTSGYPGIPVVFSFLSLIILFVIRGYAPDNYLRSTAIVILLIHSLLMITLLPFPKIKPPLVIITLVVAIGLFTFYGRFLF